MKYFFPFLLFVSFHVFGQQSDITAAKSLTARVAPKFAPHIRYEMIKADDGKDVFELKMKDHDLVIGGNSSNSMAVGLNYYLKNYCHTSVSWYSSDSIYLPAAMPVLNETIHQDARCGSRFMLNYCTFGYTMPWWTWKDWERFVDWMALNGINMPLAITGQEAVWYNVWKKLGLTDQQIRSYFTGPAYLPWHRMANIDHWDGPLPQSWLDNQLALQKKIVQRERALGMKPILPAFAGHVPEALKTKFPNAKITSLGEWGDFDVQYQSYFLDPFDSLFKPIQHLFLEEQTKLFGTDHIYGTDPFNEITPPSWEPDYLASVANTIYTSMTDVDANAQWLQMTWIFYFQRDHWTNERIKAFLRAVPQDKMILLDYYCDNTEIWKVTDSFFGQPYIWCYLGNFGGNTMSGGYMKQVEERMENTFQHGGSNMWGLGSTLEGFGVNPVMYEYVFDKAWHDGSVDVDAWMNNWAARRYGKEDAKAEQAWHILLNTTYSEQSGLGRATLTNSRPVFEKFQSWTTDPQHKYDNKDLLKAWQLLNETNGNSTDVFRSDLVSVGRQVLGNYFKNVRDEFTEAYKNKDVAALEQKGKQMIAIINDMDRLLATDKNSLLGNWIAMARAMGKTSTEKEYYEHDAKRILTVWGQKGRGLVDYANRSWAGLMKTYYGKRWQLFIDQVIAAVKAGKEFDDKAFLVQVKDFEEKWVTMPVQYASHPTGNSIAISKALYTKYAKEIEDVK
ncbi:MAG: alpha-N-acetylglucosaminidase [Bacteroidetes bacterium]|nr:alpha-N-acetylglucosaminidase [Bacteroidota bacterium]